MDKNVLIAIGSVLAVGSAILIYRKVVPPKFKIIKYNPEEKKGIYKFGRYTNFFGNSSATIVGRAGWSLDTFLNDDGTTTFNLNKDGKYYKNLATK